MEPGDDNGGNKRHSSVKIALVEVVARLNAIEVWQKTADTRFEALESRLGTVERDVAVIKSNYATKEDLHAALHVQTWRIIRFLAAYTAAIYFIARYVH
jgi:hypothetical protein